ncbi:3-chloro-4-hydroxyphenylacetate reductive dehalogenase precursor [Falsiruegeria litorea R37]|uniref:3-chloro-4-hydroxyphenylacetate reductive dehalogenase n=1 Tax=Falsiruegeria litorea R37 TaxID=1200284 RepID=A0A1Y5SYX2_9RHOB|nr:reductive dehalogenase domain-containing protein [Falsiruegeria litorea]SLN48252.1 3-chloro-4-hydroxyphenylacetate reductive dehalogenase precursor [Falsiruegeria litorea R37]
MSYPSNRDTPQKANDAAAGIDVTDDFERFTQRNDVFTRAMWDDRVKSKHTAKFFASYRMEATPRRGDGFTQKDFALRNAAWLISDVMTNRHADQGRREGFQAPISNDTPVAPMQVEVDDPAKMSAEIKRIATFFGADLCGVTDLDERWLYTSRVDTRDLTEAPLDLPEGLNSVIVLGHEMDKELVATYPSALAGAATGREYSHEASVVMQLAAYIRNLGYEAVPSMNDTGLVIPYAVKAGLGEYARNQMVITPEFGPRLRFSKIFTNLPLSHDTPEPKGVKAFCDICTKCADACPVKALPYGPPSTDTANVSAIKGVRKWTSDAEKCFSFWAKLASDCAICMRVCPFNRDYSKRRHRLWLKLALSPLRKLALRLAKDHGQRSKPADWWGKPES